jgi:F0F1-type ATP synthase beta subunit
VATLVEVLLEKVLPPAVTGVGSALLSVWRMTARVVKRIDELQTSVASLEDRVSKLESEGSRRARVEQRGISARARMAERYAGFEGRIQGWEQQVAQLRTSFEEFYREQNEQWQSIVRALGRIEGYQQIPSTSNPRLPAVKK